MNPNIYVTSILFVIGCIIMPTFTCHGQNLPVKPISDRNGAGTGTVTWSADTVYLLEEVVFVNPGDTLTIEPGTVIKGKLGNHPNAAALFVARDAIIFATGTETSPIIFTSEIDDVDDPFDLNAADKGLWGGVYILGNACTSYGPNEASIEGIATSEPRGYFGGKAQNDTLVCDDADDSGVFSFVSIRHSGGQLGPGNETNALTLAGVGSGTRVDHIETIYSLDDGIEFLGGTVCTQYIMSGGNDDDAFDYDMGYRGTNQFWVGVNLNPHGGNRAGEFDGGFFPSDDARPFSRPTIYNATFIGPGNAAELIRFRDNAGGIIRNSIFYGFQKGISIEMRPDSLPLDSYDRLISGDLELECNIFFNVANNDSASLVEILPHRYESISLRPDTLPEVVQAATYLKNYLFSHNNLIADPLFINLNPSDTLNLSPRPTNPIVLGGCAPTPGDSCLVPVSYIGAFTPGAIANRWARDWTFMDQFYRNQSTTRIFPRDQQKVNYQLFPNPAKDRVTLQIDNLPTHKPIRLELYDGWGRLVWTHQQTTLAGSIQTEIPLTKLSGGIYWIRVHQADKQLFSHKLMVK